MPSDAYLAALRSPRWRQLKWRRIVLAGFRCERCDAVYVGKRPKQAMRHFHLHHVSYRSVGRESLHDVRILCPRCHLHPATHPWRQA
jgi:hypothetical protein